MITVNGFTVISGRMVFPRTGLWHAELDVDTPIKLAGKLTINIESQEYKCIAISAESVKSGSRCHVEAIAARLDYEVEPRYFRQSQAKNIARQILGSLLSASSSKQVLEQRIGSWTIARLPVRDALKSLVNALQCDWRALPDGSIWLGRETWSDGKIDGTLTSQDGIARTDTYRVNTFSAMPGTVIGKKQIERVEYIFDSSHMTTVLTWGARPTLPLEAAVDHYTSTLDFYAHYLGRVVSQNADGSLEIKTDDPRLPGFSHVPILYGVAGITAKVKPGSRVAVSFTAGNPSLPVATLWEAGSVLQLNLDATLIVLNGGTRPIARVGDIAGPYTVASTGEAPKILA